MIEIINNSSYHIADSDIKSLFSKLFDLYGISKKIRLEIVMTDKTTIKKYNTKYRNDAKSTNVLSFPNLIDNQSTKIQILGTIMICPEYIVKIDKTSDFNKYLIHGFLHIIGYNHDSDKSEKSFYKEFNFIAKKIKLKEVY